MSGSSFLVALMLLQTPAVSTDEYARFDRLTPFDAPAELGKGNVAVGIVVGSMFVGVGIAIGLVIGMGLN